jgi:hypothetical protein
MNKIYLDMDGTLVDLYGQQNWLERMTTEKKGLFLKAKPLINIASLQRLVKKYNLYIEIITWLPPQCSSEYGTRCQNKKRRNMQNVQIQII